MYILSICVIKNCLIFDGIFTKVHKMNFKNSERMYIMLINNKSDEAYRLANRSRSLMLQNITNETCQTKVQPVWKNPKY